MTAASIPQTHATPELVIVDVWSRTAPRYRRRAVFMLSLMALLFGGLCCFTLWLRTGHFMPWEYSGYGALLAQSFRPVGTGQITLQDFLMYPISVQRVPMHGVTMGLLFASLSSIPLLVAILYRFPCSIVFAGMVVFLAVMPWLGVTVLLGCFVTAVRPFKLSFRYASALLGLVPIAIYFVTASWQPAGAAPSGIENKALLYAPWFLALLGSCVICALGLGSARLIGYRPGGIPPVLAVLVATPVLTFFSSVGRDELAYHILEHEIGPSSAVFRSVSIRDQAKQEATRIFSRRHDRSYDEILRERLVKAVERTARRLEEERAYAVHGCDLFIQYYSSSRYVPSVLFLKGRALDQRIRHDRLISGRAEFHWEFPSIRSRATWETLLERFPEERHVATVAMHRLALLHVRGGEFDAALKLLERLRNTAEALSRAGAASDAKGEAPDDSSGSMLRKAPASSGLGLEALVPARGAARLEEMIRSCRADKARPLAAVLGDRRGAPGAMAHPLALLMSLDESDTRYGDNLTGLMGAFPQSETAGYVRIRQARGIRAISRRIARFRSIASEYDGRPAGAAALYELAGVLEEDWIMDEAKATLDELVRKYPDSCWSDDARERLSSLVMLASGGD